MATCVHDHTTRYVHVHVFWQFYIISYFMLCLSVGLGTAGCVWGELASHKRPTAPVLKAGHLSVP